MLPDEGSRRKRMKTAIVYYSKHHGNTKKLLDAIAAENEVTLIDVTEQPSADLSGYDRIGFASGIYYNSFAKQLLSFAQDCLPEKKDVFYLFTHFINYSFVHNFCLLLMFISWIAIPGAKIQLFFVINYLRITYAWHLRL